MGGSFIIRCTLHVTRCTLGARATCNGERVTPYHTRELGHNRFTTQISHFGRRAMHTRRPCRIRVCENQVHFSRGTSAIRSRSIFTGSFSFVRSSRVAIRCTWVSTTTPSFFLNQHPSTTFAVLRPTPGSCTSSSIVSGTCPPCRSTNACANPMIDRVRSEERRVGKE